MTMSAAGEALQMLPPKVAVLRTCPDAKQSAVSTSTNARSRNNGLPSRSEIVVNAPIRMVPFDWEMPLSSGMRPMLIRLGDALELGNAADVDQDGLKGLSAQLRLKYEVGSAGKHGGLFLGEDLDGFIQ
jgi:hypothetical protein